MGRATGAGVVVIHQVVVDGGYYCPCMILYVESEGRGCSMWLHQVADG